MQNSSSYVCCQVPNGNDKADEVRRGDASQDEEEVFSVADENVSNTEAGFGCLIQRALKV